MDMLNRMGQEIGQAEVDADFRDKYQTMIQCWECTRYVAVPLDAEIKVPSYCRKHQGFQVRKPIKQERSCHTGVNGNYIYRDLGNPKILHLKPKSEREPGPLDPGHWTKVGVGNTYCLACDNPIGPEVYWEHGPYCDPDCATTGNWRVMSCPGCGEVQNHWTTPDSYGAHEWEQAACLADKFHRLHMDCVGKTEDSHWYHHRGDEQPTELDFQFQHVIPEGNEESLEN